MFAYFNKYFTDAKIYMYNYFNNDTPCDKIYPVFRTDDDDKVVANVDDKKLRIDTLLFVRQFKNTYYKYTNREKFNPELYNSFVNEENFDGGLTAFDDDEQIRIFDKYVIEYIKHRNEMMTYLQCKGKEICVRTRLEDIQDILTSLVTTKIDVLFAIDMTEKELFSYCYGIIQKTGNLSSIKNIAFSMVVKYNGEFIRMKLNTYNKNKNNHPYLILERFLA